MKQLKKVVLILMCTGVMMGITACGNNTSDGNTANDNAATEGTTGTDGTTNNTDNNGGIIEDIGEDVQNGINDVEEGVGIENNTDQNTNNTNNTNTTTNTTDENLNR